MGEPVHGKRSEATNVQPSTQPPTTKKIMDVAKTSIPIPKSQSKASDINASKNVSKFQRIINRIMNFFLRLFGSKDEKRKSIKEEKVIKEPSQKKDIKSERKREQEGLDAKILRAKSDPLNPKSLIELFVSAKDEDENPALQIIDQKKKETLEALEKAIPKAELQQLNKTIKEKKAKHAKNLESVSLEQKRLDLIREKNESDGQEKFNLENALKDLNKRSNETALKLSEKEDSKLTNNQSVEEKEKEILQNEKSKGKWFQEKQNKKIKELKDEIKTLKENNKKLDAEIQNLRQEIEDDKKAKKARNEEISQIEKRIGDRLKLIPEIEESIKVKKVENGDITSEIIQLEEKKSDLENGVKALPKQEEFKKFMRTFLLQKALQQFDAYLYSLESKDPSGTYWTSFLESHKQELIEAARSELDSMGLILPSDFDFEKELLSNKVLSSS